MDVRVSIRWGQSIPETVGLVAEYRNVVSGSASYVREYVRRSSRSTLGMECQRRWRVLRAASSHRHNLAWNTSVVRTEEKQIQGRNETPR